jgi:putative ABC transport system permease protein
MWRDIRLSLRSIRHRPAQALVVVVTLGLGIGASTAIFSVVNGVLLKELPYPDADQVYLMRTVAPDGSPTGTLTPPELRPFYDRDDHPIVEAAALAWSQEVQMIDAEGRAHASVRYGVTDQFFEVFGEDLELGQPFDRGQPPGPIVISYRIWRDLYGSDPDIVGKSIGAEGGTRQVAGVTRASFEFPEDPGYWFLMSLGTAYDGIRGYRGFVRLRDGRTAEQFRSELAGLSRELGPDPATNQTSTFVVQPFIDYVVGDLRYTVSIVFGAIGILLLIACINVTNLLLTRATTRGREMALRVSLGARRSRVMRQLLTESVVLSVFGGLLGVAAAAVGIRVLLGMLPAGLPRIDSVAMEGPVLLFALGLTVLTGLVVGLAPAWRVARNPLRALVNEAGRGTPGGEGGPGRNRLFSVLVVTEIAAAVLLVIGASLLVRTYVNLSSTEPGFDAEGVLTFFLNVGGRVEYREETNEEGEPQFTGTYAPMADFFRELEQRIGALPGVTAVADVTSLPLDDRQYDPVSVFQIPGQGGDTGEGSGQSARNRATSPDYFRLMRIPLLAGRSLEASDRRGAAGVAVVDQSFAAQFFPGQDPLGQRIRFPTNLYVVTDIGFQFSERMVDELEIVGIVGDVRYLALAEPPEPTLYLANEQWINRRRTVLVRTGLDDPESLVPSIRTELESMDPTLNPEFSAYRPIVEASIARERLGATLLTVFGLIALVLAAVGIYGLMAYSVVQRWGEIAVRTALGATGRDVLALIMGRGVRLAVTGIVAGVAGAIVLRQLIASQLYGIAPLDPLVFVLAPVALFGVAALACYLPARRATRVDAVDLLRAE